MTAGLPNQTHELAAIEPHASLSNAHLFHSGPAIAVQMPAAFSS